MLGRAPSCPIPWLKVISDYCKEAMVSLQPLAGEALSPGPRKDEGIGNREVLMLRTYSMPWRSFGTRGKGGSSSLPFGKDAPGPNCRKRARSWSFGCRGSFSRDLGQGGRGMTFIRFRKPDARYLDRFFTKSSTEPASQMEQFIVIWCWQDVA